MKEIDIIRHGIAEEDRGKGNLYSPQAGLSEEGRVQVTALSREYASRGVIFDAIYSSPLRRAKETAEEIAQVISDRQGRRLTPIVLDGLQEPDWGELVGQPFTDFPRQGNGYDLYAIEAGQEPFLQVAQRVRRGLAEILGWTKLGERVAVVIHGPIAKIVMDMLRYPDSPLPQAERDLPESDQLANAETSHMVLDAMGRVIQEERIKYRDVTPQL